jgi:rubrerythrin
MGVRCAEREHGSMIDSQLNNTGRALRDPAAVVREARRMVGLERHYNCSSCGAEHNSWSRVSSCPDCGQAYASAVIRRAAFA